MAGKKPVSGRDDHSKYVYQSKKIDFALVVKELPWTPKQQQLIQLLQDKTTKCVFIRGPAGTSKSIVAVYAALRMLTEKRVSDIIYIRSAVESASHGLGYLPGSVEDKLGPYLVPFHDKLEELLDTATIKKLTSEGRLQAFAVGFLRGVHLAVKAIIVDEAQSLGFHDLVTITTRIGPHSKLIVCYDPAQSDLKNSNRHDIEKFVKVFNDEECRQQGIHTFEFTKEDIVRSEFVKFIVGKLEQCGYGDTV